MPSQHGLDRQPGSQQRAAQQDVHPALFGPENRHHQGPGQPALLVRQEVLYLPGRIGRERCPAPAGPLQDRLGDGQAGEEVLPRGGRTGAIGGTATCVEI